MNAARHTFSLTGTSTHYDPRTDAVRGDLADVALAATRFAPHYAEAIERACAPAFATLYDKPEGEPSSELLQGERFWLLDISGGWAWGYCGHDHYVGYLPTSDLEAANQPTPVLAIADPVEVAKAFLGQPYIWGGRGGAGIDCSGLVQRSVAAAGIKAPRDSDMQRASLGQLLNPSEPAARGDLIFFPGHVGMLVDAETLIHATRHHGKVVIEPLADVVLRIAAKNDGTAILARKRVSA